MLTWSVDDNHLRLWGDGSLQLVKVDGPFRGGAGSCGAVLWRRERAVHNLATRELTVADVSERERKVSC